MPSIPHSAFRISHWPALFVFLAAQFLFAQSPPSVDLRIVRPNVPSDVLSYRQSLPEERPPLRGWRSPILENASQKPPFDEPDANAPPEIRKAADFVALRLAPDGLLPTLAKAVEIIGAARFGNDAAADAERLRTVGLPVDLLPFFVIPGIAQSNANALIRHVAERLQSAQADALNGDLAAATFRFTKSRADFRVVSESGEESIGLVRLQLAKGEYWHGLGDGGALDIIRQLTAVLPDASFLVSTERDQIKPLVSLMRLWPHFRPERLTIVAEPMTIGQWAQDNGKAGVLESDTTAKRRVATLVPRYVSRGDDGSTFVPGESFMADGWAAAGYAVFQSPLLFQGGNLMAVREPKSGERTLLIGEAEVYRNTALGLTRDQVLDAFRIEMGVDRCVVLPAVSYHIDYEISIRAVDDRLVAVLNDPSAAAEVIVSMGLNALRAGGKLSMTDAISAREMQSTGRPLELAKFLDDKVFHGARQQGQFPESLARCFSNSLVDSDVGNLQRFLLGLDLMVASAPSSETPPTDPNHAEYIAAIRRRNEDRKQLRQLLSGVVWKVFPVPSLAEAERGINYLNGIHAKGLYLMPAYGGFYEPLDAIAAKALNRALGPDVKIFPIRCAESQRRNGALHCAAGVYPCAK